MIFRLIHPGTAARGPLQDAALDYQGRIKRQVRVEEVWVKASRRPEIPLALSEEADRLLAAVRERDHLVLLDRTGVQHTSEGLAQRVEAWMSAGHTAVCFALGSASGLGGALVSRPGIERISLGALTLPHDLARVVLWEQLYRALTILRGEPYHK